MTVDLGPLAGSTKYTAEFATPPQTALLKAPDSVHNPI